MNQVIKRDQSRIGCGLLLTGYAALVPVSVLRAFGKFAIVSYYDQHLSVSVGLVKVDWEKKECVEVPLDEPVYLVRARDNLAADWMGDYRVRSVAAGCNDWHLQRIDEYIEAFKEFAEEHPERMKQPSVTQGRLK